MRQAPDSLSPDFAVVRDVDMILLRLGPSVYWPCVVFASWRHIASLNIAIPVDAVKRLGPVSLSDDDTLVVLLLGAFEYGTLDMTKVAEHDVIPWSDAAAKEPSEEDYPWIVGGEFECFTRACYVVAISQARLLSSGGLPSLVQLCNTQYEHHRDAALLKDECVEAAL